MSRPICPTCQRPTKVCLCDFIEDIDNQVEVGILQHPSEVNLVKGTAKIAQLSLSHCQTWCGEDLHDLPGLVSWLETDKPVFLLYPEIEGQTEPCEFYSVEQVRDLFAVEGGKLLILDGTWRKTHKIMMLNSVLRGMDRVSLQPSTPSVYRIRKQKDDESSLSTIEALYEALSQLEDDSVRYQPLLNTFESMQQQQAAFTKKPE
ncbi:MAG: DTW domain-containing protein [Thiomicrorhabdus sp.]|jgi:DTW domain-containing protein YfiP|nr:DTW domain-containing protein [Thiomicrorhabdus sp.]